MTRDVALQMFSMPGSDFVVDATRSQVVKASMGGVYFEAL
jgi:hypothetical protein